MHIQPTFDRRQCSRVLPSSVTYQDFHIAVQAHCVRERSNPRTLESYLLALLGLAEGHAGRESLYLGEFGDLLAQSFRAAPVAFDDRWRADPRPAQAPASRFARWRAKVIRQVVDLREFAESGALEDDRCYFGIQAARGGSWCNFDPLSYVECAMAGSFGDPTPEDCTNWHFADRPLALLDARQALATFAGPRRGSMFSEPVLSWAELEHFAYCGQCHV